MNRRVSRPGTLSDRADAVDFTLRKEKLRLPLGEVTPPPLHFVHSRFGSVSLLHFKVSHRWPFAVELFAVCLFEQNAE